MGAARLPMGAARPPVGAARPPVGPPARPSRPQMRYLYFKKCRIWTLFQGCVFRKYIVHMFKILTISKRGSFEQIPDNKLKNGTLMRVPWCENSKFVYYL